MNFFLTFLLSVNIDIVAGFSFSAYSLGLHGLYPHYNFLSTGVVAPESNWVQDSDRCAGGHIILGPRGWATPGEAPVVLDAEGDLVYSGQKWGAVMDWEVQTYKGEQFITFWNGTDDGTHGHGQYYMLNSKYEVEHIVAPGNDLEGDLHEFEITDDDTALMSIYAKRPVDLSDIGGPKDGWIHDGIFQEVDIETGEVLFEWHAADHYEMSESFNPLRGYGDAKNRAWDTFHLNSVAKDEEGNYYVSMRYTHSVTCVRPDGSLGWKLGGTKSSFKDLSDGAASDFKWQHHARMHDNDTLTLFDNGKFDVHSDVPVSDESRGLAIHIDETEMTAEVIAELWSPDHIKSNSQGSMQLLDNGNYLIGWGHTAAWTEYSPEAEVLCNVHFAPAVTFGWGWVKSYRAMKAEWYGTPTTDPDVVMWGKHAYVSWNGATEVRSWEVQSAESIDADDEFTRVRTAKRQGFESAVDVEGADRYVRLRALDADGYVLGISKVLDTWTGKVQIDGTFESVPIHFRSVWPDVMKVLGVIVFVSGVFYLAWTLFLRRSRYNGYSPLKIKT